MKTKTIVTNLKTHALILVLLCFAWQSNVSFAQSIMDYFQSAEARSAQGDHEGAISDLNRIIAIDPEIASAYERRGTEYAYLQKAKEAYDDYSRAIQLNPQGYSAYSNRGKLLSDGGHHEMALTDYDVAIALAPNDAIAYAGRARTKLALGRHEEALSDSNQAILLDPANAHAYNTRGATYYALEQYAVALVNYDKARELEPKNAMFHNNAGQVKQRLNDYRGSIGDFNKTIELHPQHADAYFSRAYSYYVLLEWQASSNDFRQHLILTPNSDGADNVEHFIWLSHNRFIHSDPNQKKKEQGRQDATTRLKQHFAKKKAAGQQSWTHTVAAFLGNDITQEQFFAAAETNDADATRLQLAEAAFYAGTKRLLENDTTGARKLLQQCVDAKLPLLETPMAKAELNNLK